MKKKYVRKNSTISVKNMHLCFCVCCIFYIIGHQTCVPCLMDRYCQSPLVNKDVKYALSIIIHVAETKCHTQYIMYYNFVTTQKLPQHKVYGHHINSVKKNATARLTSQLVYYIDVMYYVLMTRA